MKEHRKYDLKQLPVMSGPRAPSSDGQTRALISLRASVRTPPPPPPPPPPPRLFRGERRMCTGKGPDSQFRERSLRTSVRTHRTWTARRLSECNLIKLKVTGGFELSSGEIAKLGLTYLSRTIFVVAGSESLISSSFFFSFDHDVTICRTHRLASG